MISSMTAFARADTTDNFGELCWELRSVNHRYLEASFRLPETLRSLEPELRDTLRGQLGRGKLDCWLKIDHAPQSATPMAVDEELVGKLIALVEELSKRSHNVGPADALELLRFPGVIVEPTLDVHQAAPLATELFATALSDLKAQREREGGKLAELVRTRLVAGTEIVGEMRILTSDSSKSHRDRLMSRLQELLSESQGVNPERLEQEVAFLAQKSDISEELDRLDVHLEEARHVIAQGGPAGRRLDFLMQELNREANTVGAKSVLADMSKLAVDLKVLIEQAREQIQNIE